MAKLSVEKIQEIKELKYLKGFKIDYKTKSGKDAVWELVSRQGLDRLENEILKGKRYTDGVMVFAIEKKTQKVLMIREYRVSVGNYVYMFPAGLSDENEDIKTAAIREFKEETGMTFTCDYVSKARYVSPGIINECVNIAFGYCEGSPSTQFQDDKEDAEVVFVDKAKAIEILEHEDVPFRSAQLLEYYFNLNPFFKNLNGIKDI